MAQLSQMAEFQSYNHFVDKSNLIYARSLPDTREAASKRNGVLHCPQSAMSRMAERMGINNTDHLDSQTIGQMKLRYHILGILCDTEI